MVYITNYTADQYQAEIMQIVLSTVMKTCVSEHVHQNMCIGVSERVSEHVHQNMCICVSERVSEHVLHLVSMHIPHTIQSIPNCMDYILKTEKTFKK